MKYRVEQSSLKGEVLVPGSKSHTIRALVCGLLADGTSRIMEPLDSSDTRSCLEMVRRFGAGVVEDGREWRVTGRAGEPALPEDVVDVGNSGTSLYIGMGAAALAPGYTVFTGDHQIRNRPAGQLLESLGHLGAQAFSTRGNGKPPLVIRGRLKGGRTSLEAHTSQYLSSLLLAAPCASGDSQIDVPLLNEAPYVAMTLGWMERLGIQVTHRDMLTFRVPGRQRYRAFNGHIPADFSSATFFLVAAAITGGELVLRGLDFNDTQGDKEVVNILREMGTDVELGERHVAVQGRALKGGTFDLNAIPDALPALAVAACCASGETRLVNVPQARLKETDRIAVMCAELKKMGAQIEELPDGLVIRQGPLSGAQVNGHADHRVVMSLAVAGLVAGGTTVVDTAESVAVTFPGFGELMRGCGAAIGEVEE